MALPGRAYPVTGPALAAVLDVVARHGYAVAPVAWSFPDPADLPADPDAFVTGRLAEATPDGCDLVVGKSLGTRAASYAGERGWPAVWVTPLLRDAAVVAGVRANPAPQLLVCGAADPLHDAEVAGDLAGPSVTVLELPGVDHALSSTGDWSVAPDILAAVASAADDFTRRLA
ncbi:alpha/beta hydrolase [Nocardioides litoris]|uniref:alpha/beta hydrolase n=1 Tax=Nocardioides litoris TaxID=1926648 RepID=UPI001124BA79|nr:alpha/beta hydrolase [Nocardioides litoris]